MRVRFAVLLPCLAMVVWTGIVGVSAGRTYVRLRPMARAGGNAAVSAGRFQGTIVPGEFAAFAVNAAVVTHSHSLTAMNMPGALLEMPVAVALTHPADWYPRRLGEWTPSLLVMPVCCLPAWWLVGLGVDGLLRRRLGSREVGDGGWESRVQWLLLLPGSLLSGMFLLLLCGYLVGWMAGDREAGGWVYAGLGAWTALFTVPPIAVLRGTYADGGRKSGGIFRRR